MAGCCCGADVGPLEEEEEVEDDDVGACEK